RHEALEGGGGGDGIAARLLGLADVELDLRGRGRIQRLRALVRLDRRRDVAGLQAPIALRERLARRHAGATVAGFGRDDGGGGAAGRPRTGGRQLTFREEQPEEEQEWRGDAGH